MPSSSRSRDRVACVTCTPAYRSSRSASSSWERTCSRARMSAIRACRAVLVSGVVTAALRGPRGSGGKGFPPGTGGSGRVVPRRTEPVPGHALTSSRIPGQRGDELVRLGGGQDQRRRQPDRVRLHRVDQEPGPPGGRLDVAAPRSAVSTTARHSPAPRTPASSGWPICVQAGRQVLADRRDVGQQPVALDGVEHGQGRGAGDRVAAEGGAVVALGERRRRPRRARRTSRSAARRPGPWPGSARPGGPRRPGARTRLRSGRCRSGSRPARAARRPRRTPARAASR